MELRYDIQIFHPGLDQLKEKLHGESVDIIADKKEALAGIFEADNVQHRPRSEIRSAGRPACFCCRFPTFLQNPFAHN